MKESNIYKPKKFTSILILTLSSVLIILIFNMSLHAGEIHTWTDEEGVVHITNRPPPKDANLKETIKYKEITQQRTQTPKSIKERIQKSLEESRQKERMQNAKNLLEEIEKNNERASSERKKHNEQMEKYQERLRKEKEFQIERSKISKKINAINRKRIARINRQREKVGLPPLRDSEAAKIGATDIIKETNRIREKMGLPTLLRK